MQKINLELVELIAKTIEIPEPIYEFGSFQVPGQEEFADLRKYFPGKTYVGCDMREGLGVDKIMNFHSLELESSSVGTVICIDTLEHVEQFWRSMDEFYRVLRGGGWMILTSVMKFEIHDHPYDYWRFTPEAFRSLTKKFETRFIYSVGNPKFPKVVVAVCFKGKLPTSIEERLRDYLERWKMNWDKEMLSWKHIIGEMLFLVKK